MTDNQPTHDRVDRVQELHGPFRDEADVVIDHAAQHDDISKTQLSGNAAVEVSAEHVSELLYETRDVWDPRESPGYNAYSPASPDRQAEEGSRAAQE